MQYQHFCNNTSKCKKVCVLAIALITGVKPTTGSSLQSRKWQLIEMS